MPKLINVADITLSKAFLVRETINPEVVEEYIEALQNKSVFPPIDVFILGRGYMLADGWHRVYAYRKLAKKSILANIHDGDDTDCLRFCLKANQLHGLRRSNADKRRAVTMALAKWPDFSEHEIADLCGVSHTYVGKVKDSLTVHRAPPREVLRFTKPKSMTTPTIHVPASPPIFSDNGSNDVVVDGMGFPIPKKILDNWSRSFEVQEVIDTIKELARVIDLAEGSNDPLWHEVMFQAAKADLDRVLQNVQTAKPYAVCTNCQGQIPETCTLCGGKGFISKFRFDNVVPEEIREMRKQQTKDKNENSTTKSVPAAKHEHG